MLATRSRQKPGMALRAFVALRPTTLNEAERSVDVVSATESPVTEMDYSTWERWPTVLLVSGCRNASAPLRLLDNHRQSSTADVLGSAINGRAEANVLIHTIVFASAAEDAWSKMKEGHLPAVSIGRKDGDIYPTQYKPPVYVPAGRSETINGRAFVGPVRVITDWEAIELSIPVIPADPNATVRSEDNAGRDGVPTYEGSEELEGSLSQSSGSRQTELRMNPNLKAFLSKRGLAAEATDAQAYVFLGQQLATRGAAYSTDEAALNFLNQPVAGGDGAGLMDGAAVGRPAGNPSASATIPAAGGDGASTANRSAPFPSATPAAPVASAVPSAPVTTQPADPIVNERNRCLNIRALCDDLQVPGTVAEDLITRGVSFDAALPVIRQRRAELNPAPHAAPGGGGAPNVTRNERDVQAPVFVQALTLRAFNGNAALLAAPGQPAPQIENIVHRYSQMPLLEVARRFCAWDGHNVEEMLPIEIAQRALCGPSIGYVRRAAGTGTLGSLPAVLAQTTNSVLGQGFREADVQWRRWIPRGEDLTDFEERNVVNGHTGGLLQEIPENDVAPERRITNPQKEPIKATKYGEAVSFSFEALMANKLGWLSNEIRDRGRAGSRTINYMGIQKLTSNPTMATDSVALFHANHGNLIDTGSGGAPGTTQLELVRKKLRLQTGLESTQKLDLSMKAVLVPSALEGAALRFCTAITEPGATNDGVPNQFRGTDVIVDANLDDNSAVQWYAFGNVMGHPVLIIQFLTGFAEQPILEDIYDAERWSRKYITRHAYGLAVVDWRNVVKNMGA